MLGGECLTVLHYFSGPSKFGLGEAISAAAARRGIKVRVINRDILRDAPICLRTSLYLRMSRPLWAAISTVSTQASLVPPSAAPGFGRMARHPAWTSIEQSSAAARSGERNTVGNTVCGGGSCCPVRGKEAGTALHIDARESGRSWCRPELECLVVARTSRYQRRTRRRARNPQHFLFWSSSLGGALLGGFFSRSRRGSTCAPVYQSGHPSRGVVPATALRRICQIMVGRHDMPRRKVTCTRLKRIQGLARIKSAPIERICVCQQPKSKREDKEAENELHVGGLRRPSQTLYLVPGWESTGRRLWDCIDAALSNDTDASGLTRLYGQADFQGPLLELVKKVRRAIQKEFTLEQVVVPKPSFWVAQQRPSGYPLWRDACSWRPRCKHSSGLVGTGCTAGDGQKDRNHWSFPACGQARQRRPFTNPRCV